MDRKNLQAVLRKFHHRLVDSFNEKLEGTLANLRTRLNMFGCVMQLKDDKTTVEFERLWNS